MQLVSDSYRSFVGVVRRSDSGNKAAGAAPEIVTTSFESNFITAVQTGAGNLKLILWTLDDFGGIIRVSDSGDQAGAAAHIAIAITDARGGVVIAVRTGSAELKLISWNLTPDNQINRIGDGFVEPGVASLIQILNLGMTLITLDDGSVGIGTFLLTAHCKEFPNGAGRLQLITRQLNLDGIFTLLNENLLADDDVDEISLTLLRPLPPRDALVATTVRTVSGNAKVIAWLITLDGSITRRGHHDIGEAIQLASAFQSASALDPTEHLVVSFRNKESRLLVTTWEVSRFGDNVVPVGNSGKQAGVINGNALVARPNGVLSAIATASGKLKLINWRIDADGSITRTGDSSDQAGAVGRITLGTFSRQNAPLVTAVERGDGDVELISWDDNPARGEII